ncbi:M23 family metallopeptidase [Planosporangium sp. 12N6]|uniref:M23 family metallopeptidase n=1 Tax=Planosporangium spinosum TaxID=3402278 RepID=UPI003CF61585
MSMSRGSMALVAGVAVMILAMCGGTVVLPLLMAGESQAQAAACGGLPGLPGALPSGPAIGAWSGAQVANAAAIVTTGKSMNVPPRGYVVALATAMQESKLLVLANDNPRYPLVAAHSLALPHQGTGHDNDSVGLFQQRPNPPEGQGSWGTVAELMQPAISARKFYTALLKVPGWDKMRLTDAAQAVQRSGFPEAYQQWEDDAEALAAQVLGLPDIGLIGGGPPQAPCGLDNLGPVPVGPGGWVQPVRARIMSPFGPRGGAFHAGADLGAGRDEPIRAATAGVVEVAVCQSSSGTCDRDGSPDVQGCGWYVDIRHAGNIVTRYCHMGHPPRVQVGQRVNAGDVIGFVGSSGNSSGVHLHFEVHLNVPAGAGNAGRANAVDPVAFMQQVGASIGK